MSELKPCPFCGGDDLRLLWDGYCETYCVDCKDCGCTVYQKWDIADGAIEAWNNRAGSEELAFTRQFIHEHGLDFALASAWEKEKKDGK